MKFCKVEFRLVMLVLVITSAQSVRAQKVRHFVIDKMAAKEMTKGITLRSASGVNGTFGQFIMKKDAFVPMHSHENEQYSFILAGSVEATIGDTVLIIKAGEAVVIPPNVPHSFKSLAEGTVDLDFFAPRREDWINGTADYFKK
jgi:quercetin dioxygenase-like cupin family protein